MRFLVPSYGRAGKARTIDLLRESGLKRAEIVISTQTEQDYDDYINAYGEVATVVYRAASNLSGNANTALSELERGEIAVLMDDDIRGVQVYDPKPDGTARGRRGTAAEFMALVNELSEAVEERGANVGVAYPTENPLSMKSAMKAGRISRNRLGSGWLMVVRGGFVEFDESLDSCEDYDVQLREICAGRDVVRLNCMGPLTVPRSKANGEQDGGRGFYYEDDRHRKNVAEVVGRYAPIAKAGKGQKKVLIDTRYV